MRWTSSQLGLPDSDWLLAMDWTALGGLIERQAFDAMAEHLRIVAEHCGVLPDEGWAVEPDRY